jgi:pyridoxal 5'-phosphate synthase pdxT subunit
MARIGVLALQGGFARHAGAISALGGEPVFVRSRADFEGLSGLVLPGGESTVQQKLLERLDLEAPLRKFVADGRPVFGTCAGLIVLAARVTQPEQRGLGLIDVLVARNAWGRQVDSFEAVSDRGRALVFIRAPRIVEAGPRVEVLDRYRGEPVLVRQGNVTCATFHPELTGDPGVHALVFEGCLETSREKRRIHEPRLAS